MTERDTGEAHPESVCFGDVQRVLSLFVRGLTGRALNLESIESPSPGACLGRILNDGVHIFLPAQLAEFGERSHNIDAYRIAALHQIGYLEHGTNAFDFSTALETLPSEFSTSLQRNMDPRGAGPNSASPNSDLEQFFASWRNPSLLRQVFLAVEDLRIDTIILRCYPGARADLKRVLAHSLSNRPPLHALRQPASLLEGLVQFSLGAQRADLEVHDISRQQAVILNMAAQVKELNATVYDSSLAALGICVRIEELIQAQSQLETIRSTLHDTPLSSDINVRAINARHALDVLSANDSGALDAPDDAGLGFIDMSAGNSAHWGAHTGGGGAPVQNTSPAAQDPVQSCPLPNQHIHAPARSTQPTRLFGRDAVNDKFKSFFYDEWDFTRQTYLKAWCRLYEQRLSGDNFGFIEEVRRRYALLANQIRKQFSLIKAGSFQRVHHTSDGEELDLEAIVDGVVERRVRHAADTQVYIRRDRSRRDVCAAFLVDMSASTDFPVPEPGASHEPESPEPDESDDCGLYLYSGGPAPSPEMPISKRRVIDVAKDALGLMCDALHNLGDRYGIYGFSGQGRGNVEFYVAKEFDDMWSARTSSAIGAIQPRRSTRTGAAIRHAISKIASQSERTKVLIIVSDGYPEDSDYGPDRNSAEYGIQDTACALQEARRAGILSFCITIDRECQIFCVQGARRLFHGAARCPMRRARACGAVVKSVSFYPIIFTNRSSNRIAN
jgi:nitric oxide reductase NorD protein